jgi:hypothetical protein
LGLKLWEFFCEQTGKKFGTTTPFLFLCLTKKQEQGKKSVKMLFNIFYSLPASVPAYADGTIIIQTINQKRICQ